MTETEQKGPEPTLPEPTPEAPLAARPWYVSLIFALLAISVLLGGVSAYNHFKNPFPFFGTSYTPPKDAPSFSGTGQDGRPYTFAPDKLAGKTTALFFGFTHCPNICPITLAYLQKVKAKLTPQQQKDFQVVFVSVDPERDTPAQLKSYTDYFGGGVGVNIPEPQLSQVARGYGVGYSKADIKSKDVYQINHTTATYLIDRAGKLRLLWDYTQLANLDKVAGDIREVMR